MGSENAGLYEQTVNMEDYIRPVNPSHIFNSDTREGKFVDDGVTDFIPGALLVRTEEGLVEACDGSDPNHLYLRPEINLTDTASRQDTRRAEGGTTTNPTVRKMKGLTTIAFDCICDVNPETFFEPGSTPAQNYVVIKGRNVPGRAEVLTPAQYVLLLTGAPENSNLKIGVVSGKADKAGWTRVRLDLA